MSILECNIDDFGGLVSELFRAKLRASFNSKNSKPYTSRHSYFRNLEKRSIVAEMLRENREVANDPDLDIPEGRDFKFDRRELIRKLTPWHSSDFSLEFSPISDERFGCTNNSLLEKEGKKTFYDLKKIVSDSHTIGPKASSCRSCVEDRHQESLRVGNKVRTITQFVPVDCALKPMIKTQGLGIKMEVSVNPKISRGETRISIDDLRLGEGVLSEFSHPEIDINKIIEVFELSETQFNSQKITINYEKMGSSGMFEVAQIWKERGYRENLFFGFMDQSKSNSGEGRERLAISPDLLAESLVKVLTEIRKYWNPALYTGPELFLQRDLMPRIEDNLGKEKKGSWDVQYLKMGEETKDILEAGLSENMRTPILLDDKGVGKISIHLDNTELWM